MLNTPDLLGQFTKTLVKDNVGIIEFAESDQYCGKRLYPRQKTLLKIIFLEELDDFDRKVIADWGADGGETRMSPRLDERLDYLREHSYQHFRTIQLVGGRRSGKSMLAGLIIAYKLYKMTQLDNPGIHYGIDKSKDINFTVVAASLEQAKAQQFGDVTNWLLECKPLIQDGLINKVLAETISVYTPYDKRHMNHLAASGVKPDRDLATLKVKAHGTNSKTIRGAASIVFTFDEMAHLIAGESRMSDEELFKAAIPALAQFGKDSMIVAISSPYTKTGKFFELYEQSLELDPPSDPKGKIVYPDHFMLQFPSWELYKDWDRDKTIIGPLIRRPEEDPIIAREEKADPDSFRVEYRSQFAEVIDAFLRPDAVQRMFSPEHQMQRLGRAVQPSKGAVAFTTYKAHADPSSEDANFGIAVAHVEKVRNEELGVDEDHVVFDMIDAFYPEDFPNSQIDYLEVIPELVRIINDYRPFELTFDQFNSVMPIQEITRRIAEMGIAETQVYEVTATAPRNLRRAKNFRAALNLGRVHAPHPNLKGDITRNSYELARLELGALQEKNGKIIKQSIGPVRTKDIADCIMECVDALIGDTIMQLNENLVQSAPMFGSHGGYGVNNPSIRGNTNIFEEISEYYAPHRSSKGVPMHVPGRNMRPRRMR